MKPASVVPRARAAERDGSLLSFARVAAISDLCLPEKVATDECVTRSDGTATSTTPIFDDNLRRDVALLAAAKRVRWPATPMEGRPTDVETRTTLSPGAAI